MEFRWRETSGPIPKVEADVFGSVCERLANGQPLHALAPSIVVEEARKRTSPIHALFVWDNDKAANAYRVHQARKLIGMLEIVHVEQRSGRSTSSRAFYSVVASDGGRGYMAQDRVLLDRDLRLNVIGDAHRDLQRILQKYGVVLRTFGSYVPRLTALIDDMRSDIDQMTDRATKPPTRSRSRKQQDGEAHARA